MSKVLFFDCYKFKRKWLLVEMLMDETSDKVDLNSFAVPEIGVSEMNWQVPYAEQYLNEDGTEKICKLYEEPQVPENPCRIVFFIYKTDGKILCTPYGKFSIENPKKLPKRLKRIVEFENPD